MLHMKNWYWDGVTCIVFACPVLSGYYHQISTPSLWGFGTAIPTCTFWYMKERSTHRSMTVCQSEAWPSHLVKFCPATVVSDINLCSVAQKGLSAQYLISQYGCMVERGEPIPTSAVWRGSIREQDLWYWGSCREWTCVCAQRVKPAYLYSV